MCKSWPYGNHKLEFMNSWRQTSFGIDFDMGIIESVQVSFHKTFRVHKLPLKGLKCLKPRQVREEWNKIKSQSKRQRIHLNLSFSSRWQNPQKKILGEIVRVTASTTKTEQFTYWQGCQSLFEQSISWGNGISLCLPRWPQKCFDIMQFSDRYEELRDCSTAPIAFVSCQTIV